MFNQIRSNLCCDVRREKPSAWKTTVPTVRVPPWDDLPCLRWMGVPCKLHHFRSTNLSVCNDKTCSFSCLNLDHTARTVRSVGLSKCLFQCVPPTRTPLLPTVVPFLQFVGSSFACVFPNVECANSWCRRPMFLHARSVLFMCAIIATIFLWQRPHDTVATSLRRERSEPKAVRGGEERLGGCMCVKSGVVMVLGEKREGGCVCMSFVMCVLRDLSCVVHRSERTHVWNSLRDTQAHDRVTPS